MEPAKGRRISFWIPAEYEWLFNALDNAQRLAEARGVRISQADVILSVLVPALERFRTEEKLPEIKKVPKSSRIRLKRSVICRRKDQWLLETIDRIVESKVLTGMRTSFSTELFRLAKNGLTHSLIGSDLDRAILKGHERDIA